MGNRWLNALIKTVIFLIAAHIILVIWGLFAGGEVNLFGLRVFWAHWTGGWTNACISIILTIITYFIIYFFFTRNTSDHIEEK